VVVAYGTVQYEGSHYLCGQQCVVEFFHEYAGVQEMVNGEAQGEEEVMAQDSEL
jgi:hypothetical protein